MGLGFGLLGLGWTTRRGGPGISLLCVRSRLVGDSLGIVEGVCFDDGQLSGVECGVRARGESHSHRICYLA